MNPTVSTEMVPNEAYLSKLNQSNARLLALVKASMDVVVAIGLLQLAPKKVTPRLLPSPPKAKTP